VRGLRKVAGIFTTKPAPKYEIIEENPEKAAEWLAARGVKIRKKGEPRDIGR
jgi:hypothetical protein